MFLLALQQGGCDLWANKLTPGEDEILENLLNIPLTPPRASPPTAISFKTMPLKITTVMSHDVQ